MFNRMMKKLADLIGKVGKSRKKFEVDHPDEPVLAADLSKGIVTAKNQRIQRGHSWITAQRAVILLTDQQIVCGRWTIPLDTISSAQLLKIGSGQVLKIQTKDDVSYQFGMQSNPEWTNQQILPLTLEKGKLNFSLFSIIVRLVLIGYLIYRLAERLLAQ